MKYIAFAAEKAVHEGGSIEAIPGFGGRSDLWVMLADGTKAWPLTNTPNVKWSRVIIPQFSHDGSKLTWAEQIRPSKFARADGWSIKVADLWKQIKDRGCKTCTLSSLVDPRSMKRMAYRPMAPKSSSAVIAALTDFFISRYSTWI